MAEQASGLKYDTGKPRVELIPAEALIQIAEALTFGAKKYDSWNWAKGISYSRLIGALLRHVYAFMRGQDKDEESNLSHLAHAGCCIVFLIWMHKFRRDKDDRFPDPNSSNTEEETSRLPDGSLIYFGSK